jgi:hypothetical protein
MCFLRDFSAEYAMATLMESLPYQDWIIGVGLESDERASSLACRRFPVWIRSSMSRLKRYWLPELSGRARHPWPTPLVTCSPMRVSPTRSLTWTGFAVRGLARLMIRSTSTWSCVTYGQLPETTSMPEPSDWCWPALSKAPRNDSSTTTRSGSTSLSAAFGLTYRRCDGVWRNGTKARPPAYVGIWTGQVNSTASSRRQGWKTLRSMRGVDRLPR